MIKTENVDIPMRGKPGSSGNINTITGVFVGEVIDNTDSIYTGRIKVRIGEFASSTDDGADRWCLLCTPYGGFTQVKEASDDPTIYGNNSSGENATPKSYGLWPQPPAIGTVVAVAYTASMEQGIVIGTLMFKDRNHMLGGRASAEAYDGSISPVGEKNPYDTVDSVTKPVDNDFKQQLEEQGLHEDYSRGHSASSARRESPSNVFGITTLNGHVITMDDGDHAGMSKNIRVRSRGGAQILLDDTNKFVFVNNHNGSAWIEIDETGHIDIYSANSISIHTEEDFNVHAKGNINMQADQEVNIRSTGSEGIKIDATVGDLDIYTASSFKLQAGLNGNIKVAGSYKETAARIDMNGPVAASATRISTNALVSNQNILASACTRVPEHHPWRGASTIQETFETAKGNTA
jgi:hypothetical protein